MTTSEQALFEEKPLYVVLFATTHDLDDYEPIVGSIDDFSRVTIPHGLDRDVATVLPALWYCLHLPGSFFDLVDLNVSAMKASQVLDLGHEIFLAPVQLFMEDVVSDLLGPLWVRTLVLTPDSVLAEVAQRAEGLGFALPTVAFSQLSNSTVKEHWEAIHEKLRPTLSYLGREPSLSQRLDIAPLDLPTRRLARQLGSLVDADIRLAADTTSMLKESLWLQAMLAAMACLETENATIDEAKQLFEGTIAEERSRIRVPIVIGAPGVAPAYVRDAFRGVAGDRVKTLPAIDDEDTWSRGIGDRADHLVERASIEFAVTHRAIARTGVGLVTPSVPDDAFIALAELERHIATARTGRKVWGMLHRLDDAIQGWWTEATLEAIARASTLTVFSNFPIGLLRLPGDTSPISCRVPIAYRPLIPLTRTVQMEVAHSAMFDLTKGLSVLVAQCLPEIDPVGHLSRSGWDFVAQMLRDSGQPASLNQVETLSVEGVRAAIAEYRPDILVLTAHGVYGGGQQGAGLAIGAEVCQGPGLGPLPPVVILSSCHVAPRGTGTVSVADLLLREGATCVLGTQVPINVRSNTMIMMRFFLYMAEIFAGREDYSSLLEIWHRVQTSNAVNDILSGNASLHEWAFAARPGEAPVIREFMDVRSVGRVRLSHVYKDSEEVLLEIADERGDGDRVRALLESTGYVPESAFYVFIGRPDRIYLRLPIQASE